MLYNTLPTIELKLINILFLLCLCAIMFFANLAYKSNKLKIKVLWIGLCIITLIPTIISLNSLNIGLKEYEQEQQNNKTIAEIEKEKEDPKIEIDPLPVEDPNILSYKLTIAHNDTEEIKNIKANIIIDAEEYSFDIK